MEWGRAGQLAVVGGGQPRQVEWKFGLTWQCLLPVIVFSWRVAPKLELLFRLCPQLRSSAGSEVLLSASATLPPRLSSFIYYQLSYTHCFYTTLPDLLLHSNASSHFSLHSTFYLCHRSPLSSSNCVSKKNQLDAPIPNLR